MDNKQLIIDYLGAIEAPLVECETKNGIYYLDIEKHKFYTYRTILKNAKTYKEVKDSGKN